MRYTILSSKRQLTLSKYDLDHLGVEAGSRVTIDYEKDALIIRPKIHSIVEELEGALRDVLPESKYAKTFDELLTDTKRKTQGR